MPTIKLSAELINNYNEMTGRFELYGLIKEGLDDIAEGNTRPFSEAMSSIMRDCHIKGISGSRTDSFPLYDSPGL